VEPVRRKIWQYGYFKENGAIKEFNIKIYNNTKQGKIYDKCIGYILYIYRQLGTKDDKSSKTKN